MKAFILLSVIAVALASREECGENSHYNSCGTACALTCDNYRNPPKFCILMCKPGCHCDEDYVKTSDEHCVKPENGPPENNQECGENSHCNSCGTACPLTCDNYRNPPKVCILMCKPGCHCDEGYVKTSDGRCVKPENCPPENNQCGENSHYNSCGTACPLTCDNYKNPPKVCILMCKPGCHCDEGYVKTSDERCVKNENCPPENNRVEASSDICSLPAETGLCHGYFPRYHFNKNSGECEKFIYGGCGGNENNFQSVHECQEACSN